jgi:integrase
MATIRKRGELQWQAIVKRKGVGFASKTFATRKDAEDWAKVTEADMIRGAYIRRADAEKTTLGELIAVFKKDFAPHHYRRRDDEKEAWRFQLARLADGLGKLSLAAINQKAVAKYRDGRLKGSGKRPPVGDATVRKEMYLLSKLFRFAETEQGIVLPHGNPVLKIRKPRESRGRDRRLSKNEWKSFERECRASKNPWLWPSVQLAIETAMRQGELLGMEWQNLDKKRRLVLLPLTKNGEARSVPLSSAAISVINSLPRALSGKVLPVQRITLYHAFLAACQRAGIEDFTFHDLRHEALSRLAERGDFSVLELAAVSGHKTLQMLKRYTHLQAEDLAKKLG